ncbi:hypothetical protein [Streptomyces sp. URMC 125]|uniref:hypothetical protein n=1 Tax=Streptomyces sp. URMC 125 TaxID=3423419 RepID=UPI003F1A72E8
MEAPAGKTFLPEDLRVVPQEMVGRMMPYPMPLLVDGSPRACAQCGADRDWLVLNVGPHVYLRCRCAHEWHEPALTVAWYEQRCGPTQEVFSSREDAIASHGFDGMLRGIYLH